MKTLFKIFIASAVLFGSNFALAERATMYHEINELVF